MSQMILISYKRHNLAASIVLYFVFNLFFFRLSILHGANGSTKIEDFRNLLFLVELDSEILNILNNCLARQHLKNNILDLSHKVYS